MARKDATPSSSHGLNDVIGIVLGAAALLLMVALLTYDKGDSSVNIVPINNPPHNMGGPLGAWVAAKLFWVFGIGAFMIPVLLLIFGLGYLFQFLSYLQRRWLWGAVLLLCCMGLASTFEKDFRPLDHLRHSLNTSNVGGIIGQFLDQFVLHYVGKLGATIVLGAAYLISLIYLTNFKLGEWCRHLWAERFERAKVTDTESELERRARDLEKQARKLQEQVEKSSKSAATQVLEPAALGADMRPVPEPTVRDLSVPQAKSGDRQKKPPQPSEPIKEPAPHEEGMVIPAKEVAAATTAEVLGQAAPCQDRACQQRRGSHRDGEAGVWRARGL